MRSLAWSFAIASMAACAGHPADVGRAVRASLTANPLRPLPTMGGHEACPGVEAYDYAQAARTVAKFRNDVCTALAIENRAMCTYVDVHLPAVEPEADPKCFPKQAVVSTTAMSQLLVRLDAIIADLASSAEVPRVELYLRGTLGTRVELYYAPGDPRPAKVAMTEERVDVLRGIYYLQARKRDAKPVPPDRPIELVRGDRKAIDCRLVPHDAADDSYCLVVESVAEDE